MVDRGGTVGFNAPPVVEGSLGGGGPAVDASGGCWEARQGGSALNIRLDGVGRWGTVGEGEVARSPPAACGGGGAGEAVGEEGRGRRRSAKLWLAPEKKARRVSGAEKRVSEGRGGIGGAISHCNGIVWASSFL